MTRSPETSRVRKIFRVGRSRAIILPPLVLEHIHSDTGDYLYFDIEHADFFVAHKAPLPPFLDLPLEVQTPEPTPEPLRPPDAPDQPRAQLPPDEQLPS